jgi:transposase
MLSSTFVLDRGYIDFERLYRFTLSSAFFVVRTKANVLLQRRYSRPVDRTSGLRSDHTVILTSRSSATAYSGETDPRELAALKDDRLKCTEEQLVDALTGNSQPMHREMLALQLEHLQLIDTQMEKLSRMIAEAMKPHQQAVVRLAEVPGFGVDSAQQVISEVGVQASTFASAAELTSWVGTCPGTDESAEENHSSRSAKGNKYLRRVLNQAAHAAVRKKGSHFQAVFRRLLPRLGYQSAIWAIAHRLCRLVWKILHEGVRFIEQGSEPDPAVRKRRAKDLARALRRLGYDVVLSPIDPTIQNEMQTQGT